MDKIMLVWSRLSRRSRDISLRLNISLLHLNDRPPYIKAAIKTLRVMKEAKCVILQLPPGPALFWSSISKGKTKLICDVHTGMFHYRSFKEVILNRPFRRLLSRCNFVLAHNDDAADILRSLTKSRIMVVYDPIPVIDFVENPKLGLKDFILLPVSWDRDEPIDYVITEVVEGDIYDRYGVKLVITGDYSRGKLFLNLDHPKVRRNIMLTGYIPWSQYYWLVSHAKAIIALTTWKYTVLSSIWEAVAFNKPIIASYTPTIYKILGDDAIYFKPGIRGSLVEAIEAFHDRPPNSDRLARKLKHMSEDSLKRLKSICEDE
ncbi:MAG: glycosyltransferase [Desulfurococcales archaeon]|nr:glycosyltransferase [Desulfurococcales archaeon]